MLQNDGGNDRSLAADVDLAWLFKVLAGLSRTKIATGTITKYDL